MARIALHGLVLCAVLTATCSVPARAATFSLDDNRAAREIAEVTDVYIDGRPVASFRLDDRRPEISITLTIGGNRDPDGHERHRYALCGTITVRNAEGAAEIHEVNATGALRDPDGHRFEALGAEDFTRFYLSDPTDPAAAESLPQRSGLCRDSIS